MKHLFWIDLEMTGLDENIDSILEVAVIVTDLEFNFLEEYHCIVYQTEEVLEKMNDWCKKHHGKSGLTEEVKKGAPLAEVESELCDIIKRHYKASERVVLCGNSVNNDKRFLEKYMPEFSKRLHYRIIDVSSFKEIFKSKYGIRVKKKDSHRAQEDIKESIEELQSYLSYVKIPKKAAPPVKKKPSPQRARTVRKKARS